MSSGGGSDERRGDRRFRRRLAGGLVLASLALAACSGLGEREAEDGEDGGTRPVLIGRVASRPGGQDFVLLQSYGTWPVTPGTPVFSLGADGQMANLLPTGEKLGQFVAADVRSGTVEVGDAVYYRPDPETDDQDAAAADGGATDGGATSGPAQPPAAESGPTGGPEPPPPAAPPRSPAAAGN